MEQFEAKPTPDHAGEASTATVEREDGVAFRELHERAPAEALQLLSERELVLPEAMTAASVEDLHATEMAIKHLINELSFAPDGAVLNQNRFLVDELAKLQILTQTQLAARQAMERYAVAA